MCIIFLGLLPYFSQPLLSFRFIWNTCYHSNAPWFYCSYYQNTDLVLFKKQPTKQEHQLDHQEEDPNLSRLHLLRDIRKLFYSFDNKSLLWNFQWVEWQMSPKVCYEHLSSYGHMNMKEPCIKTWRSFLSDWTLGRPRSFLDVHLLSSYISQETIWAVRSYSVFFFEESDKS